MCYLPVLHQITYRLEACKRFICLFPFLQVYICLSFIFFTLFKVLLCFILYTYYECLQHIKQLLFKENNVTKKINVF